MREVGGEINYLDADLNKYDYGYQERYNYAFYFIFYVIPHAQRVIFAILTEKLFAWLS